MYIWSRVAGGRGARWKRRGFKSHRSLIARIAIGLLAGIVRNSELLPLPAIPCSTVKHRFNPRNFLTTFLQRDTAETSNRPWRVDPAPERALSMWSQDVYIDVGNMTVRAVPIRDSTVVFDRPRFVRAETPAIGGRDSAEGARRLCSMRACSNYPNSKLRDFTVAIEEEGGEQQVRLAGKVNMVYVGPVHNDAHLSVDRATNTLVIRSRLSRCSVCRRRSSSKWTPIPAREPGRVAGEQQSDGRWQSNHGEPFGLFPPPA
jgi:hypothetical protein